MLHGRLFCVPAWLIQARIVHAMQVHLESYQLLMGGQHDQACVFTTAFV